MDKYKNFVRIEEIKTLIRQGKNEEALELCEGMEPKKIKDNWDCMVLAEVYLNNGMLGKARDCYLAVYDRKKSRRVAMELVNICIRLKKADDAEKYFDDYKKMAPNDYFNYIFKYKIDRLKGKPLREQAEDLEALKRKEFFDTWGYELAKIYHKMGEREKCLKTCEDVIVWFGDGEAVDKAKTLRALYLGEISLKDLNTSGAASDRQQTQQEPAEVSSDLDLDVVIDYQMEFDHAVDAIMNKDKVDEAAMEDSETTSDISKKAVTDDAVIEKAATEEVVKEEAIAEEAIAEEAIDEEDADIRIAYVAETFEEPEVIKRNSLETENNVIENVVDKAIDKEESETNEEEYLKETYIEEEYTEEDLSIADEEDEPVNSENIKEENKVRSEDKNGNIEEKIIDDEEDDDIKIAPERNKEKTPVRRKVHENDFFTDEIAKAVEQALMEDDAEKRQRAQHSGPQDATREWRRLEKTQVAGVRIEPVKEKQAEEKAEQKTEQKAVKTDKNDKKEAANEDISLNETNGAGSKLLDAVERELGIVGGSEEKEKPVKKSWLERRKEKHKEKELRKQEEKRKLIEAEEKEKLDKEKAAELEKQRFIESEKRKDRKKFLDHQRQLALLANEKAKKEQSLQEERKAAIPEKARDDDFSVDIKNIQDVFETGETKDGIYTPKQLKPIEIPGNSIVAEYLAGTGRTLETYFGFFACQRDMSSQILKCLERLLDPEEEVMNYCIIGEKGSGKKAIVHGFTRFMVDAGKLVSPQAVWTDSNKINSIDLSEKTDKLKGRSLVIDQAGALEIEGIEDIAKVIERLHRKTMIVLADYRRNMVELFKGRENFEEMFGPRVIIPVFNQDDLFDYVDYKVAAAGFVFDEESHELISKRIKSILRATEEGALARTEKFVVKTIDNAEQRNGEAYIKQTLEHEKHTRNNVITVSDIPDSL
ncbi:MAG: hypothetical protein IKW90_09445 [Lachnospiraceae bacterium]|nr:hypothetical protein [Lachnospiraceae bacterium]